MNADERFSSKSTLAVHLVQPSLSGSGPETSETSARVRSRACASGEYQLKPLVLFRACPLLERRSFSEFRSSPKTDKGVLWTLNFHHLIILAQLLSLTC